ncbi:MAG TPA: hypothetical protein PKG54_09245 [Phycisphaerae bacterium]|jgi:hypothetical protein|nr:hypothetical protein [Phycisphaerae bacterium]HPP22913.1 hypothetical protein [Phycisphaerae bacterium]HPU34882.1 hypothetical protein [Phycisphaerae bacterium]HQA43677.1 hypothetical protein [Phycisphaerae bacterium]HXK88142.1 hypothetical protein [Phycisphaerae bacterium]
MVDHEAGLRLGQAVYIAHAGELMAEFAGLGHIHIVLLTGQIEQILDLLIAGWGVVITAVAGASIDVAGAIDGGRLAGLVVGGFGALVVAVGPAIAGTVGLAVSVGGAIPVTAVPFKLVYDGLVCEGVEPLDFLAECLGVLDQGGIQLQL